MLSLVTDGGFSGSVRCRISFGFGMACVAAACLVEFDLVLVCVVLLRFVRLWRLLYFVSLRCSVCLFACLCFFVLGCLVSTWLEFCVLRAFILVYVVCCGACFWSSCPVFFVVLLWALVPFVAASLFDSALRVTPAETRLTVYRRRQVWSNSWKYK